MKAQIVKALLDWLDDRTGLPSSLTAWLQRPLVGGPHWRDVWPTAIAFTFITQAITGLVLWMHYSPGSQTAWESVYYLQYEVQGGWWLRAIHHYSAQMLLVLVGPYLIQMILLGRYRAPREFLFWTVLAMGLVALGSNLTGDLLSGGENGFWSTRVRTGFLNLVPAIGGDLFKLAVGGPDFGHLTFTRFLALHVGAMAVAMAGLIALHAWLARRHGMAEREAYLPSAPYWPSQAVRDMIACAVVLVLVLWMARSYGLELGAPANPAEDPGTARPEWSFRGLYQFRELFPASIEIVPIFVCSGLTVLAFFAMPLLAKRTWGHVFNASFMVVVFGGLAVLSWQSYSADVRNTDYQEKLVLSQQRAERVVELAGSPQKIPTTGALTLLREDPKTQGPVLFVMCADCHAVTTAQGDHPPKAGTAPDLHGFASREWIRGLLDPKQINGPKYFGNTKFRGKQMATFVKETLSELDTAEIDCIAAALSAEAALPQQRQADAADRDKIAKGLKLIRGDCTGCHIFHGAGTSAGPELTGYGSKGWVRDIIADPSHQRFYKKNNDRMPSYAGTAADPGSRILGDLEIGLVADWIRGDWYRAAAAAESESK